MDASAKSRAAAPLTEERELSTPPSLLPSALPRDVDALPRSAAGIFCGHDSSFNARQHADQIIHEQPLGFTPYFALVSSSLIPSSPFSDKPNQSQAPRAAIHHPRVHYIFSDDDPEQVPLASAVLDVLDPVSPQSTGSNSPEPVAAQGIRRDQGSRGQDAAAQQDHRHRRREERCILVDLDATGTQIVNAQSMAPDWAVTSAEIDKAPAWDSNGDGEADSTNTSLAVGRRGTASKSSSTHEKRVSGSQRPADTSEHGPDAAVGKSSTEGQDAGEAMSAPSKSNPAQGESHETAPAEDIPPFPANGLMIKIEGVEFSSPDTSAALDSFSSPARNPPLAKGKAAGTSGKDPIASPGPVDIKRLNTLADNFQRGVAELNRVAAAQSSSHP